MDWFYSILNYCHVSWSTVLWGLLLSTAAFVISLLLGGLLLIKLPANYFVRERSADYWGYRRPILRSAYLFVKNVAGMVMLVLGIIQLVTPGQGLLFILVGIMLVNFPGKRRFERWLVSRPKVLRPINRLRAKFGKPPLILNAQSTSAAADSSNESNQSA